MMRYIALLRGINVGGKHMLSMSELKQGFEKLDFSNVITYINSGNIIFSSDIENKKVIMDKIRLMIQNLFNLDIPIFILTVVELEELLINAPNWWGNDNKEMCDNLIFIIPPSTCEEAHNILGEPKAEFEKISSYKNSVFWSYSLKDYRKTNWWSKTASTSISNSITIRNANTMKKILELCNK